MYLVCYSCKQGYRVHQESIDLVEKKTCFEMDMSTMCGAGVVGRYMLSNVLIQNVGSPLIAKSPGSIRTNAHLGSKKGGINKEWQFQRHQRVRLTRSPI